MAAAYAYAEEGGQATDELALAWAVAKYGAQAIYGRTLSFHELRMMDRAENIFNAYRERSGSDNWAKWAEDNPEKARLLAAAGKLYDEALTDGE